MKWFEHRTSDRAELAAKLIKRKFGLEGYGIWNSLIEIIGENINGSNIDEWGFVSKDHTMASLSEEIGCSIEIFTKFVNFCDDNLILEKKNNRLFCSFVLDRMNEYARKIVKNGKSENKEISEKEEKPEIPANPKNPRNNTTTTQHNTTQNENIGDARPKIANNLPKGVSTIGSVLQEKYHIPKPEEKSGIHTAWQEKAFRYAEKLGITLADEQSLKSRWLKVFKQAAEGKKPENIEKAYSYLIDYDPPLANQQKIAYFFWIYENGMYPQEGLT